MQIRPLIGLNERQAAANANYRAKLYRRLISDGVNPILAEQRADKAAVRYASKQHRYRAETIVNTELAFAYNQGAHEGVQRSIKDGYMNHCEMVWTTAGTNRVCGRCMELKDTVVGRTDESGVTLPPLHPRCRCAIVYREVKEQPKLTNPRTGGNMNSQAIPNSNERAIVFDNGNRNDYTVNFNLMNTKAYHDRFENLTKRKQFNESLYKQAIDILGRRSGTDYEETVILDARTGEMLAKNDDLVGIVPMRSVLTEEQKDYLEKLGREFVALHNHPNSSFPSPEDIETLFVRNLETGSVIACHNGTVYFLDKLKPFSKIKELLEEVQQEVQDELMGFLKHRIKKETSTRVINRLVRQRILKFKEMS